MNRLLAVTTLALLIVVAFTWRRGEPTWRRGEPIRSHRALSPETAAPNLPPDPGSPRAAKPSGSPPAVESLDVGRNDERLAKRQVDMPQSGSGPVSGDVPRAHSAWPGAEFLDARELPPLDGLTTRLTLLRPTNFPYAVYVEEQLNQLEAPLEQRLVRRFEAVASHLLVKLRPGQTVERLVALARQFDGRLRPHPSAADLYYVELPSVELGGVPRAQAILSQYHEIIEYAEPDAIVRGAAVPNDTRFAAEQWGLNNTGQDGGTADLDIDAPEAWDIRREATNIIVAVVDSGIRYTHEDLAANMWRNPGEIPANGVDDDANGIVDDVHGINAIVDAGDPADDLPDPALGVGGHGTSVAGVIGAVGNNGKGMAGVAWSVKLMSLKWFNNQGAGALSDAVQCLDYARTKGAAIVNASWQQGGLLSGTVSQSMMDALQRLRQAGILFVSSAGNDGVNNDLVAHYPSNYPFDNMVAVAAGTRSGSLWRKSNFGERLVDVVAPGENILSTTSKADDDYSLVSGTSFAAPHVSGMLALLKAQFPSADYRTLINRLLAGADRRDRLAGKVRSGAFVNLFNALSRAGVPEFPEITNFTFNGQTVASQQEVSILQGSNVTLTAIAAGTPPLVYAWQRDAKVIAGATAASFSLTGFAASDIGEYRVTVSNTAGVVTLGLRLLGVVAKPEVAAAVNATNRTFLSSGNLLWESQTTVTRDGISAGASGRIGARQGTLASTTVTGPGRASFMWKVSSERNNDTLDCLIDGMRVDAISGEVDWSKKEFQISAGAHELVWRYIKDASLSKGEDKGYLDLFEFIADAKTAPSISVQPTSQTVLEGASVFFSVVAVGSSPLRYYWQKDDVIISNVTSNRLDLLNVTMAAEGRYSVIVSNEAGIVTSASARLTVTPTALPPRIAGQPADLTVDAGSTATFAVTASGTPPLRFQWRKGTANLPAQTNAALTLSNTTLADSGAYSVVVANPAGADTSREARMVVVQLQLAPTITKQPVGQMAGAGERLELAVEAAGLGPFSYEWTRDSQVLAGENQAELVRTNVQPADAGNYQVKVSSPFGVTLSALALVRVSVSTPPLSDATDNTNFLWSTDGDALWFRQTAVTFDGVDALQSGPIADLGFSEVSATIIGPGQVSFWWKVSSEFNYDFLDFYVDDEFVDGISGDWDWEETIWNIPEGTHRLAWVYAKDDTVSSGTDAGWLDEVLYVSFNTERPVIVRHPLNESGVEGGEVTFDVETAGSPPLTYQWFKDNVALPGATSRSLTIRNLTFESEAFYHVAVSNRFGYALSRVAYVTVFDESGLVDFALNSPGLIWTSYDSIPWFAQTDETTDGESALQSGFISHSDASWLGTAVVGPGILYFSWKVSSEEDYDFLEFLVDDQLYDYISGEVDWQQSSFLIPPGLHFLDWVYFKDETADSGADAGWLDYAVQYVPLDLLTFWKNLYFTPDELVDDSISGNDADPDTDGIANLAEYAFDLDPRTPGDVNAPLGKLESDGQATFFVLTYRRQADDTSLQYERQVSMDLTTWTTTSPAAWSEVVTPLGDGAEEVTARYLTLIGPSQQSFFRVRVQVVSP